MIRIAVFRADASTKMGGGHVYRCLTLAEALAMVGWRCVFACKPGTNEVVPALGRSGHEMIELDARPDALQLAQNLPEGVDLLVVDHYGLDASFESACRPWARQIMALDDGPGRQHDCDVLLDQNFGAKQDSYQGLVPDGSRFLLGTDYALLRPQFSIARQAALARRSEGRGARNLLVSLGAADTERVSSRVVAAAAGLPVEIDVVLGVEDGQREAIPELDAGLNLDVRVHVDVADMASLMAAADFAVGAAGSTTWERCCLGLPTIMLVLAENQRNIASSLNAVGASRCLGDAACVTDLEMSAALERLYQDDDCRLAMSRRAAAICDGLGAGRVVSKLVPERTATGKDVTLKPVELDDSRSIWVWQNEPQIRQHFRNPCPPTWDEHQRWFERYLGDPGIVMSMIEIDNRVVGLLRFDFRDGGNDCEISILISTPYQGQGIGRAALRHATRLIPWARIVADIKPQNTPSRRAFLAAGFVEDQSGSMVFVPKSCWKSDAH